MTREDVNKCIEEEKYNEKIYASCHGMAYGSCYDEKVNAELIYNADL